MDVSHQSPEAAQNGIRWPTDWMHRHRMQSHAGSNDSTIISMTPAGPLSDPYRKTSLSPYTDPTTDPYRKHSAHSSTTAEPLSDPYRKSSPSRTPLPLDQYRKAGASPASPVTEPYNRKAAPPPLPLDPYYRKPSPSPSPMGDSHGKSSHSPSPMADSHRKSSSIRSSKNTSFSSHSQSSNVRSSSASRASSAPRVSAGAHIVAYSSRRNVSPCRRIQQHSPHRRLSAQVPGPSPSPDLLLADKAEWKRTLHDTTYRTYKALPRSTRPFGLRDFALLREIFALAENLRNADEVRLMDVLRAYDMVLQKHKMDPAEDTFYYRMLLKLSLRSEKDWWKKLNQEIVKNDVLTKVTSFRNHKLLLCYWLQWRCHHEKGVIHEKVPKKGQHREGENAKSSAPQDDCHQLTDVSTLPETQQQKSSSEIIQSPIKNSQVKKDSVVGMDLVELDGRTDIMRITATFQSWQRVSRQRKKKRLTREKSARNWKLAESFNGKNVLSRVWRFWQRLAPMKIRQANIWHQNLVQQKCFSLWGNHCRFMHELFRAGEEFHAKRLSLSVLSEWKAHISHLKNVFKGSYKKRVFRVWKKITTLQKHAAQVTENRTLSLNRKLLFYWRSRLAETNQRKAMLFQYLRSRQIHTLSLCFQGWLRRSDQKIRYRNLVSMYQSKTSQRIQIQVMQKWKAWIEYKHSLRQVNEFGISWRRQFLLKEAFKNWLRWWNYNNSLSTKSEEISCLKRRRIIFEILNEWLTTTRTRKCMQQQKVEALNFYSSRLCRKSFYAWAAWKQKHKDRLTHYITIMDHVAFNKCRKVFLQWRCFTNMKANDAENIRSITEYCQSKRKSLYWRIWWQKMVTQVSISRFCENRNYRLLSLIMRELQSLTERSEQQKMLIKDISPPNEEDTLSLQTDTTSIQICLRYQSRNLAMRRSLSDMKESVRKWKHFVEIKHAQGPNNEIVVKFWGKFWLKSALEGLNIVVRKNQLKRKLYPALKQAWNRERGMWANNKLDQLQDLDTGKENIAMCWRNIVIAKLSILGWGHVLAVKKAQIEQEISNMLHLKQWWVATMLIHWKTVAQKYANDKSKISDNQKSICDKEHDDVLQNTKLVLNSDKDYLHGAWNVLTKSARLDKDTKANLAEFQRTRLKQILRHMIQYTNQQRLAKAMQAVRRSSLMHCLLKQWRQSAYEVQEEKPVMSMIRGHIIQFPKKHKIMSALMDICPRWVCCKAFHAWREWSDVEATKNINNRKAWEHFAVVLQKKAITSFQSALVNAEAIRKSVKHYQMCCQVKALMAWKAYTVEREGKKAVKNSALSHFKTKIMSKVLGKWRLYSYISQKEDFAKRKADAFWRMSTVRKCLHAWSQLFLKYKDRLQYFTWIKIRMDFHCLHNVICAWRYLSHQRITQRNHLHYIKERRRMTLLYQKFHIWVGYIHKKKCSRAAQEMHRRRHLKTFFHSWIFGIEQIRQRKEANETVKNHTFNKFCRNAFLGWQDVTIMARHARDNQMLAINKLRHAKMSSSFYKWKDTIRSMQFVNEVVNNYIGKLKQKVLLKWLEIAKQQEKLTENHISLMCLREKRCMQIIFSMWLQKTFKMRNEKERDNRALMIRKQLLTRKVFKTLNIWMHARQMKQGFSLLACGKLQDIYMKRAFAAWFKYMEANQRLRTISCKLQGVWHVSLIGNAFNQLKENVAEISYLRETTFTSLQMNVESSKIEKLSSMRKQNCCRNVFRLWQQKAMSNIDLHRREELFKTNVLRRAFNGWRSHCVKKAELQDIHGKLAMYHQTFVRRRCWHQWQLRVEDAQYQQQFLLFKTIRAWLKYAKWKTFWRCLEQDAKMIMMQSLQKRIFWAWQSLVREIAIRREEHQQQRYLQREAVVLANRMERKQKVELLSLAFKAWNSKVQQALRVSAFIAKQRLQLKQSIWGEWWMQSTLSSQAKSLRFWWTKNVLRHKFNIWRQACQLRIDGSKVKEAEAERYCRWKSQKVAWTQWTSYVISCKDRVKALKDCLTLIQTGQHCDSVREMIRSWKDYASERIKRREQIWAAEAAYRKHKLTDYLTAWHHYIVSSKDLAASLRGTIQVYKRSGNSPLMSMAGPRSRFRQGFGHISSYGSDELSFQSVKTPSVVIEEVNVQMDDIKGSCIARSSRWTPHEVLLDIDDPNNTSASFVLRSPTRLLDTQPLWDPTDSIEYLGTEVDTGIDDWSLHDVDMQLMR